MRKPTTAVVLALGVILWSGGAGADDLYELRVDGLACPFCAYGIEKMLNEVEGVKNLDISINKGVVSVTLEDGSRFTEETARQIVEDAGFTLRGFRRVAESR